MQICYSVFVIEIENLHKSNKMKLLSESGAILIFEKNENLDYLRCVGFYRMEV